MCCCCAFSYFFSVKNQETTNYCLSHNPACGYISIYYTYYNAVYVGKFAPIWHLTFQFFLLLLLFVNCCRCLCTSSQHKILLFFIIVVDVIAVYFVGYAHTCFTTCTIRQLWNTAANTSIRLNWLEIDFVSVFLLSVYVLFLTVHGAHTTQCMPIYYKKMCIHFSIFWNSTLTDR